MAASLSFITGEQKIDNSQKAFALLITVTKLGQAAACIPEGTVQK
jgi:hypothetical protein